MNVSPSILLFNKNRSIVYYIGSGIQGREGIYFYFWKGHIGLCFHIYKKDLDQGLFENPSLQYLCMKHTYHSLLTHKKKSSYIFEKCNDVYFAITLLPVRLNIIKDYLAILCFFIDKCLFNFLFYVVV